MPLVGFIWFTARQALVAFTGSVLEVECSHDHLARGQTAQLYLNYGGPVSHQPSVMLICRQHRGSGNMRVLFSQRSVGHWVIWSVNVQVEPRQGSAGELRFPLLVDHQRVPVPCVS